MAYGDFKDLNRRAAADKVLRDKHLILLEMQNMADISVDLEWFIDFLIKKTSCGTIKNKTISKSN